jgi:hypothetical protein
MCARFLQRSHVVQVFQEGQIDRGWSADGSQAGADPRDLLSVAIAGIWFPVRPQQRRIGRRSRPRDPARELHPGGVIGIV